MRPAPAVCVDAELLLRMGHRSRTLIYMEYSTDIIEMLGAPRVMRLQENLAALRLCLTSAPDRASWVKHLPIPLRSSDRVAADDELVDHLLKSGPDWFYVIGVRPDGGRMGYASAEFRPLPPHSRPW